jgi:hypothetical protein
MKKGWYKSAQVSPITGLADNEFSNAVKVSVIGGPQDSDVDPLRPTVDVKYRIDVDYRSWGIKDINIYAFGPVEVELRHITYDANDMEQENETTITVELDKLQRESVKGDGVWVQAMDLQIDENFQVDYEASFLTVVE